LQKNQNPAGAEAGPAGSGTLHATRPMPYRHRSALAPGRLGPRIFQERESSESPMLNAFCRVAPSVLFSFLAILEAGVFLFAIDFSSRTSVEVHARRFFVLLAIEPSFQNEGELYPLRE